MLATLRHPCVVQCIGATDAAATPWLVLEYLERTLYEAVADAAEPDIVRMLCDVLSACAYIHSRPRPIAPQLVTSLSLPETKSGLVSTAAAPHQSSPPGLCEGSGRASTARSAAQAALPSQEGGVQPRRHKSALKTENFSLVPNAGPSRPQAAQRARRLAREMQARRLRHRRSAAGPEWPPKRPWLPAAHAPTHCSSGPPLARGGPLGPRGESSPLGCRSAAGCAMVPCPRSLV